MDLRKMIELDYQEAVTLLPDIPSELRRALKANERVPLFFRNLEQQLKICQGLTRENIKSLVYEMTKFFAHNLRRMADEMHMSDIVKSAEKAKASVLQDLDSTADGKPQGEFTDLVKETNEKRTTENRQH